VGRAISPFTKEHITMPMTFPIEPFFNTSEFAYEAKLMPVSGSGATRNINVIFDSEYSLNVLGNISYQNDKPTAIAKSSDLDDVIVGSLLYVNDIWFRVLEIQAEPTGTTTLILSKDDVHG
jgi:hypothetical protein